MNTANSFEATKVEDYKPIKVSSPAFNENGAIATKYTCDGSNVNPPLYLENIPEKAKTLAIIVEDPDAPGGTWVHWVVWNIPVTHLIKEKHTTGMQGLNDFRENKYGGPCPPSGTHRYYYKIYALDTELELPPQTEKKDLEQAMSEHIIGFGFLLGRYSRKKAGKTSHRL